jgi:hypothetical protein
MRLIKSSSLSTIVFFVNESHWSKKVQCNPALELDIKLIGENGSTRQGHKVAKMALCDCYQKRACSREASPSKSPVMVMMNRGTGGC